MCEFIKDGDTDEVKNTYYCGLRCDHPAAAASFFRESLWVQPDAGETCTGEQQPGFRFESDDLRYFPGAVFQQPGEADGQGYDSDRNDHSCFYRIVCGTVDLSEYCSSSGEA